MQGIWVGFLMRELRPFAHAKRKPSQLLSLCALEPMFCNKGSPRKVRKGNKMTSPQSKQVFSSVQFSHSVVSDSLRSLELQHARPPCLSPTPGVHPNSHPLSWWCHPAISSSVIPFSSCPQSLPASESFPVSQLFSWGGQSTGVSALASFPPKNT